MKTHLTTLAALAIICLAGAALPAQAQSSPGFSALDRMEAVFEGNHSRASIERLMTRALRLYDLPVTERYYEKAGSVLVSLANEDDIYATEMQILQCVVTGHAPGVNIEYHEVAAYCAVLLSN